MTADLTAFLLARLDEQEAAAVAAGGRGEGWQALGTGVYSIPLDEDALPLITTGPEAGGSDEDAARAVHVALHDPARVLRWVRATRRVVAGRELSQAAVEADPAGVSAPVATSASEIVLRFLAEVYADHPEYRPEWAP
ncbi:DUF6221 family protein [Streptomyces sp. NPDC088746]|uniref:DUF6221 family protein n=1 Tax=Streptomyces sp. NPDC088746 TaxID=3365885 RepID=UPI003810212D